MWLCIITVVGTVALTNRSFSGNFPCLSTKHGFRIQATKNLTGAKPFEDIFRVRWLSWQWRIFRFFINCCYKSIVVFQYAIKSKRCVKLQIHASHKLWRLYSESQVLVNAFFFTKHLYGYWAEVGFCLAQKLHDARLCLLRFIAALSKANDHMEHSIVAAYAALVLGCLIHGNRANVTTIRQYLSGHEDFKPMVRMLKKFLTFMKLTVSGVVTSQADIILACSCWKVLAALFKRACYVFLPDKYDFQPRCRKSRFSASGKALRDLFHCYAAAIRRSLFWKRRIH